MVENHSLMIGINVKDLKIDDEVYLTEFECKGVIISMQQETPWVSFCCMVKFSESEFFQVNHEDEIALIQ